ncbi:F0F1 ATP synthase subunit alpha, partial [bacterium]|nr:F0F1 ATP synthase subunit alpha [bacterium]
QYQPYSFDKQIVIIFAATNGFLDEIPVEECKRFEKELLENMELRHKTLTDQIMAKKELTDDFRSQLNTIIGDFKKAFKIKGV